MIQAAASQGAKGRSGDGRAGDILAMLLSLVCFLHCLAATIAVGALSLSGAWVETEALHWGLAFAATGLSAWTLFRQVRHDCSWTVRALAMAGAGFLFLGAAEVPSPLWGTVITVTGGAVLILAHGLNWRSRQRAACCAR
ncbi:MULTISPECIES: MerC domain-containing protein [Brevundimonas]|jgi:hypothetical protein|uniref:MerC domain-containing protein n=2 Tax=Brevundimonas TaxID=41275 RepID=A0A7W7ITD2_9CAUL|nr:MULTISPECIES: MerC domain-containing protein [Brevundimonas]MBB4799605.1 hypothetical protein [Brevundimonas bullata]MBB6384324.1 hypothetical protein [Brevundimonas bullata]